MPGGAVTTQEHARLTMDPAVDALRDAGEDTRSAPEAVTACSEVPVPHATRTGAWVPVAVPDGVAAAEGEPERVRVGEAEAAADGDPDAEAAAEGVAEPVGTRVLDAELDRRAVCVQPVAE